MRNAKFGMRNGKARQGIPAIAGCLFLILSALWSVSARAEVKVIEADSAYVVGDNDSKVDARRIAVQEAKRKALELSGVYVESLTVVKNYQLTRDDVKTYTAGVLQTEIVSEQMRGTAEHPEIYVKARCTIDTDVLAKQIDRFRESEELKEQLDSSARENDELRKERDQLVKQLAAERDKAKAAETRKKLDTVLAKEEANDDTRTVWINVGSRLVEVDESGQEVKQADLDNSSVVLQRALTVNPQNQQARYMLAEIYQKKGDHAAAERELRTALERSPSRPLLHLRLGVLLLERGRYEDALREFHFVERVRPHNPLMLFYTGMTYKRMGKCGPSVHYLNRFTNNPRANRFPKKKEKAAAVVEECGGSRPGRFRRFRDR
jgi:tetratricopeptide (TPR) repeat protein